LFVVSLKRVLDHIPPVGQSAAGRIYMKHRRFARAGASGATVLLAVLLVLGVNCQKRASVDPGGVARITVDELRQRMDEGEDFVFVDSRSPAAWQQGTAMVPDAIRVPPNDFDQPLSLVPRGGPVVVYCT
jgi:hypothetical protein